MSASIKLPSLRGRIGDWFYYVSLMSFKEIANRASMVPEIHKNQKLSKWIQREVSGRTEDIVSYLIEQDQRFFNAIIFGIYEGKPQWQELDIEAKVKMLSEEEREYFGRTFGILNLNGDEKIFAIDGQHRTKAIMDAVKKDQKLEGEEVTVIFVAHKKTSEGEIRTRRLFSTLNRYAVPVTTSEIIALDEEDNCAIITRKLIEESDLFKDKIQFSKTRSLNPQNRDDFTNIILLNEMITIWLTDKKIQNIKVSGHPFGKYISRRDTEESIIETSRNVELIFKKIFKKIPSLNKFFFKNKKVNRMRSGTSLLFRPIGQIILFSVLKVAEENNKFNKALDYFA